MLVVPLYLAWLYQSPRTERRSQLLRDIGLIALVPLAVSLPFIMWHPEAFVKSILFSVTRRDTVSIVAPALGSMLGLRGTIARIPLAVMLLLAYAAAFRYRLGRYSSVLLIIAIFVSFNPILFDQYFTWLLPFVPLALYDAAQPQLSRGEPADA